MVNKRKKAFFGVLSVLLIALLFCPAAVYAEDTDGGWDDEWDDDGRPHRVEPEGEGTVYEVYFMWDRGVLYEPMAVLEGQGIGPRQWLEEWFRENYTFMGWYDNLEGSGERYTMDTPIYQDTYLYALWEYAGPGGPWPRPTPSGITGLSMGENLQPGAEITITAAGHNTHLVEPLSERFRWIPVSWRVEELGKGVFSGEAPYTAPIHMATAGRYTLCITYREEVFDSIIWQETGREHEVEELPFSVGFEYADTNKPPFSSRQPPPGAGTAPFQAETDGTSSPAALPPSGVPQEEATGTGPFVPIIVAVLVLLAASGGILLYAKSKKRQDTDQEEPPPEPGSWNEDGK